VRDAYQVAKVRAAEAALMTLVPDGALMQRAAAGLATVSAGLLRAGRGAVYGARVVVLAGSGDNGGDALYAGARLAARGAAVIAIAAAGSRVHEAGAAALRAAGGRLLAATPYRAPGDTRPDIPPRYDAGHDVRSAIGRADLILDGLLGIGGKGGLREPFATLAQLAANSPGTVVAVDLPSGIDADTGMVDGPAVTADVTVTFGALKPGLLVDPGAAHAGVVEFVDIGLGPYLQGTPDVRAPQNVDIARLLPVPGPESDKYRRGVLGLLAGSDRFTGAAMLAAGGAVRGGSGMVRMVTAPAAATAVRREWPEVVVTETDTTTGSEEEFPAGVGRVQAWAAGPGMGTGPDAAARLRGVLRTSVPVLVDADGLTLLTQHRDLLPRPAPTLLTPHAGELGRLLGADPAEVAARRVESTREAARRYGASVLLKGSTTVIAPPDEADPVYVNTTGTPWLATAGTGDVLSGLAGALLAQGLLPPQAALAAAYLHGLAARIAAAGRRRGGNAQPGGVPGAAPIGASDVIRALPAAFRAVYH
jgi:ADP-dependent NAD(P)H-hydrate dehydratase / NAD(P)H-hydrate epimerase